VILPWDTQPIAGSSKATSGLSTELFSSVVKISSVFWINRKKKVLEKNCREIKNREIYPVKSSPWSAVNLCNTSKTKWILKNLIKNIYLAQLPYLKEFALTLLPKFAPSKCISDICGWFDLTYERLESHSNLKSIFYKKITESTTNLERKDESSLN
jgi:hypothetical protein